MRIMATITHPVLVLISFCLTLINGEHFGGFYLLYILMAIPHLGVHAVLAISGAMLILYSYFRPDKQPKVLTCLLNILGVLLLYASLILFLKNSWTYNYQTFQQAVPVLTFVLFGTISLAFFLRNIFRLCRQIPGKSLHILS